MPRTAKEGTFRLVYTLTSQGGNSVENTLPFTGRKQMVAYAQRLHKNNPNVWNVKRFEESTNGSWVEDKASMAMYTGTITGPKKTHVEIAPALKQIAILANKLEKSAVSRELTTDEKASFINLVTQVLPSVMPLDELNNVLSVSPTAGKIELGGSQEDPVKIAEDSPKKRSGLFSSR